MNVLLKCMYGEGEGAGGGGRRRRNFFNNNNIKERKRKTHFFQISFRFSSLMGMGFSITTSEYF